MVDLWSARVCSQEASHFGFLMNRPWICEFKAGSHGNLVLGKDSTEQDPAVRPALVQSYNGKDLAELHSEPSDAVSEWIKVWSHHY